MNPLDDLGFYVLDTELNVLHGPDGGPFPYASKASAAAAASRKNGRGPRRFVVVTWLTLRRV